MTQGQAKRLVYEAGQWTLEIEQLMAQGGHLYRPHPHPIQGTEAILSWLKTNQPVLLSSASHLFSKSHGEEDRLAYKAEQKGWASTSFSSALAADDVQSAEISESTANELAEIRQHLFLLESRLETVHKLESRIARLERMIQSGAVSASLAVSAPVSPVVPAATQNQQESNSAQPLPAEAENEVTLANAQKPELDLPAADNRPEAPERKDRLSVPTTAAMKETIAALIGSEMDMTEDVKMPLPALSELTSPCYICQIIDDAGEVEGLILTDLEATVRLGGSLMMTPTDEIATQIANAAPSEDVIDAAAEIFNNLSGVLNSVEGNKHIKVDTARPFAESEHEWLAEPHVRHDFKFAEGGRLSYLFK